MLSIVVIGQLLFAQAASDAARKDRTPSTVRGVFGTEGRERIARPGVVVAKGSQVTQKSRGASEDVVECEIPETRYGLKGNGARSAAITLSVTENCELVVTGIDVNVPEPEGFRTALAMDAETQPTSRQAGAVKRQTGGWHEQYDCCRLRLTEAYAHIFYRDDGKKVFNANGQATSCRNALDGWFGTGTLWNWSETKKTIWIWKRCSFSFIGGSFKHDLDVDVYSWPGNDWEVFCTRRGKTVPAAVFKCGKAHKKV
jgi:hypothetical protein